MAKKEFCGKIKVLDQLRSLIPPLAKTEVDALEESLLAEGRAHNPLWLWGDVLVDGHHRLELCKKHGIDYDIRQVYESCETLDDVEYCMKRDAIGRRNLTSAVQSRFRAEMVKYHVSRGKKKSDAVKIVAEESGVTARQVHRDTAKSELVEKVDSSVKDVAASLPEPSLRKLASLPKKKQKSVVKKSGGSAKKLSKDVNAIADSPEDRAKKIKDIAKQYRRKLVDAIDDYNNLKPNYGQRDRLVKIVQSVELW